MRANAYLWEPALKPVASHLSGREIEGQLFISEA